MQIPVILLIVEGGPKTFEIALESVRKNIPVLVIEGSGKAADFISKGYKLSEDKTRFVLNIKSVIVIMITPILTKTN